MSSDDENLGGYSAGYYNSVGSKEGWAPQSFKSSRKCRAEVKQQNIFDFLDEDEKQDLEGRTSMQQFDTFGFTATELARKQAEKEQNQRPDELIIVPVVTESPRARSKLDALLSMPDSTPQMHRGKLGTQTTDEMEIQNEVVLAVENVERPVDLYQAIFSDDEEEESYLTSNQHQVVDTHTHKKIQVAKENINFEKENTDSRLAEKMSATNGETTRNKEMQQIIDGSKFRKNRDERCRKRSGSRRRKSSSSESDASDNSDDYRDRHRSGSRRKEKRTSREKSSSKRRSKSHKHRRT